MFIFTNFAMLIFSSFLMKSIALSKEAIFPGISIEGIPLPVSHEKAVKADSFYGPLSPAMTGKASYHEGKDCSKPTIWEWQGNVLSHQCVISTTTVNNLASASFFINGYYTEGSGCGYYNVNYYASQDCTGSILSTGIRKLSVPDGSTVPPYPGCTNGWSISCKGLSTISSNILVPIQSDIKKPYGVSEFYGSNNCVDRTTIYNIKVSEDKCLDYKSAVALGFPLRYAYNYAKNGINFSSTYSTIKECLEDKSHLNGLIVKPGTFNNIGQLELCTAVPLLAPGITYKNFLVQSDPTTRPTLRPAASKPIKKPSK